MIRLLNRLRFSFSYPTLPLALGLYLSVLVLVGWLFWQQQHNLTQTVTTQLQQINDFKVRQIQNWLDERYKDASVVSLNPIFLQLFVQSLHDSEVRARLQARVQLFMQSGDYVDISLVDATGMLLFSAQGGQPSLLNDTRLRLQQAQETPSFGRLWHQQEARRQLDLIAPLFDPESGRYVGSLIFHILPTHYLDPLMRYWPQNAQASSFVARVENQQLQLLTPMAHSDYTPGMVFSGYAGLVETLAHNTSASHRECHDFLGRKTWAACQAVAGMPWVVVSQQPQAALLEPLFTRYLWLLVFAWAWLSLMWWAGRRFYVARAYRQKVTQQRELNRVLQASHDRYERLFFDAPIAYAALNLQGEVMSVNRAWLGLFGCKTAQMAQGQSLTQWLLAEEAEVFSMALAQVQTEQVMPNLTLKLRVQDNDEPRVVLCQARLSMQADASMSRIHCVFSDLTEQQRNALALQQAASVFEYTTEGIMITDAQGRIVSVNPAFTSILGYSAQEVVGEYPSKLKSGRHSPAFYQAIWQALAQQGHWSGEIWNRRKNGELIAEWLSIATIYDQNKRVKHYVGIFADISRLKQSEKQMLRMANQDHLTGLPNRRLFLTRLQHALETAQRKHTRLAVIMLDVDRFKGVNDSYGHQVGDALLKTLADIFEQTRRSSEMVARLGGDEFAFLLEDIAQPEDAGRVAAQLLARLGEPITLSNGVEVMLSATAGISLFPDLAQLPEQLLQQADTALYRAKVEGSGQFFYFTQSMTFQAQERLILEAQLKQALKQNQFVVFYQPKVEVETGRIIGAEALVRWQHPDLGLLSPNTFIDVCEETGLVVALGEWVLQEACRQGRIWQQRWGSDFHLAVNVAASQWQQLQWVDTVERVLKTTPYPAQNLELEITENSLLRAQEHVVSSLARLHGLGVRIAIDDFGTGYSSLSYLKRLPINSLKIDRSFVEDLEVNEHDRQLVQAMVAMAHSLHLTVVCEGIENAAQLQFIKQQACEFYQGFYTSAPLSAADFERFMQQRNRGETP